ncbi:MAG: PHP domain-containing protein [Thermodesulfobacteriota bacterium]|nr:PHP domain-containing protein [Thermodesulfobacteriota bacterium]
MGYIDLHIHTTASDGTLTPAEVVRYAKKKGLKAIAITDHDTIEGNREALEEGKKLGLDVLTGVEISVGCPYGTMHLLGYCIDIESSFIKERLEFLQKVRSQRNIKIFDKLKGLGIGIDFNDVLEVAGGEQVGRPHFAKAMIKKGYASTYQDAFERFLKKGGPAYVDRFRFEPQEAIGIILNCGGIPVLAHPFTLGDLKPKELEEFVVDLISLGLRGIEVFYPDHTDRQVADYRYFAEKHGVLITGGSDFHGDSKPDVDIGIYNGDKEVSIELVETMKNMQQKQDRN